MPRHTYFSSYDILYFIGRGFIMKKIAIFITTSLLSIGCTTSCFAESVVSFQNTESITIQDDVTYNYEVASFSTKFSTAIKQANRNHNIKVASDAIDGVIIQPNQTFSFNKTTQEGSHNGQDFKEAGILINGKPSTGIGGGICQVSTTLFNTALYSGIEITERHNHSAKVGYVSAGRDATISCGGPDLKLKNTYAIPIKIESKVNQGQLTIRILTEKDPSKKKVNVWTEYDKNKKVYIVKRSQNTWIDYKATSRYKV